jgi:hypothetical protein
MGPGHIVKIMKKTMAIPLWFFNVYWLGWFLLSASAVVWNLKNTLWFLVIAFIAVETLGILFTVDDSGTLTDTTAKYIPEDFTFVSMGLMLWRLAQWLPASRTWIVWALGAWLLQHFIVHYQYKNVPGGWDAPRKIRRWVQASVR